MYITDPNLFGKGKWTDIKKLRLVVEYDKDGTKKLSSNLSKELQLRLGLYTFSGEKPALAASVSRDN